MPVEEQIKLIDNIIGDNNEIKDIILADATITNKEGEEQERKQQRQYINTTTDPKNRTVIMSVPNKGKYKR
jgi:hypothetical protein